MTKKLAPFKVPSTGEIINVIPVSLSIETMLTRRQIPEPKPPIIEVNIAGMVTAERNAAHPSYIKAYENWENLVNIEVTERILRKIALKQQLTDEQRQEVAEIRESLEGLEMLPRSDKVLWLFKVAIGSDRDVQKILNKAKSLAEPSEEGIDKESKSF